MGNNELIAKSVYNGIVTTNEAVVTKSQQRGITLYGTVLNVLEQHTQEIDQAAEAIGAYFAEKKGLEITRSYEENCSLYEKYIRNDEIKRKEMELKRTAAVEGWNDVLQMTTKGVVFGIKKLLQHKEKNTINKYVFGLCVQYANLIGMQDNTKPMPAVHGQLEWISRSIFGKRVSDYDSILQSFQNTGYVEFEQGQAENIAQLLYMIYAQKHVSGIYKKDADTDTQTLIAIWSMLGIWGNNAHRLIDKFERLNKAEAFEPIRVNRAIQGMYSNLTIAIPRLERSQVRQINKELLQYVPNGYKQAKTREMKKKIVNVASIAGKGAIGYITENPVIMSEATAEALSMFSNLSGNAEVIGNCLEESGMESKEIADCMDAAKMKQKEKNIALIDQKDE